MAWTAPATYGVGDVLTAANLNTYLRDNLRYLKGLDGDVYIEDDLGIGTANPQANIPASARVVTVSSGGGAGTTASLVAEGTRSGADGSTALFSFINTAATGADKRIASILAGRDSDDNSGNLRFFLRNAGALVEAARFDRAGNFGINALAPAGRLHVLGAGAVAGAGMVIGSVAAVTSIQTIFAAGTVARHAFFTFSDRNNTTLTVVAAASNGCQVGSFFTYVNTDTITIAVTAGGAVTAQRTTGTSGSHDIAVFMITQ